MPHGSHSTKQPQQLSVPVTGFLLFWLPSSFHPLWGLILVALYGNTSTSTHSSKPPSQGRWSFLTFCLSKSIINGHQIFSPASEISFLKHWITTPLEAGPREKAIQLPQTKNHEPICKKY